jgi:hypothetical protein
MVAGNRSIVELTARHGALMAATGSGVGGSDGLEGQSPRVNAT